jgi:hypothetical protein
MGGLDVEMLRHYSGKSRALNTCCSPRRSIKGATLELFFDSKYIDLDPFNFEIKGPGSIYFFQKSNSSQTPLSRG